MATILYIKASPRGERSHSVTVADAFVKAYSEANPGDVVRVLDVFEADLPAFGTDAVVARYLSGQGDPLSPAQEAAWAAVKRQVEDFKTADKYVIALPMWNFSIPWRLKQFFDIIIQPGLTFSYDEQGYHGLVTGRPVLVSYARGGAYPAGTPAEGWDFQKRYLEHILGFIGFTDIRSIVVEPTLAGGPDTAQAKRAEAVEQARRMALEF